ncbi:endolytic transglycosylase MltG [Candidatus Saccharibacteria bacterium]|nr:endolytic transglycosylase MltG [Candidatus Saccharibacteria bacterium]
MKIIGLDVGTRRIGAAVADSSVKIAVPKTTIVVNNGLEFAEIARLARMNNTDWFVLGLPRSNEGNTTAQTQYVREFARNLKSTIPNAKIKFQDESLTSVEAERRLKARKRNYTRGEIDAEAAAIILQDFIENLSPASLRESAPARRKAATTSAKASTRKSVKKSAHANKPASKKGSSMLKKLIATLLVLFVIAGIGAGVVFSWYNKALEPYYDIDCSLFTEEDSRCELVKFTVEQGATLSLVGDNLEAADLVKNSVAFQIYMRSQGIANEIKTGEYEFRRDMSVPKIAEALRHGSSDVITFTIYPGETIRDIKKRLVSEEYGFPETEVNAAFAKNYRGTNENIDKLLESLPSSFEPGVEPLEGYLFGDTYEFYRTDSVDTIVTTALNAMWEVVSGNDLINRFAAHDLSLHQGITLASVVQKEAGAANSQATVAQIFYRRLSEGMALGSDVTTQYAVNLVDPDRHTYTDNVAALEIESPYNTRKYGGLPPGPICNPGVSALLAVANPADTTYLYFLTGDDGMMYYSYTEEEHNQKIVQYCQKLCNVSL